MSREWLQLLLVGLPVLMLIGAWLTLKTVSRQRERSEKERKED